MSGVLRTGAVERAGIIVAVATVHVSAFSLLALKPVPDIYNTAPEPNFIDLVELAPEPIAPLDLIEAQFDLPPREAGIDLSRDPLALPAPNTFPQMREPGRRELAQPVIIMPAPTTPPVVDAEPVSPAAPTGPTLQARSALRGILCTRLSASEGAECDEDWGDGDVRGVGTGGPVMAAASPDDNGRFLREGELPLSSSFQMAALDEFAGRQGDKFASSPYRTTGGQAPSRGDTFMHAQGAASFGSQATRDMSLRATSRPHEVWAD